MIAISNSAAPQPVERQPYNFARDWPEDFSHENGNYRCLCVTCGNGFVGHKRRRVCKVCAEESIARWNAMTPEQQTQHLKSLAEEMTRLLNEPKP